ncbi:MAG: Lrp/AsnC family transcriptional regulator, partial [Burkholderiaceae bacterium]
MDETDRQLLALLRRDARASIATLATKLGVSRGTVTNRITKLEDEGIIVGYTVRVRPDVQKTDIKAWMSIAVE